MDIREQMPVILPLAIDWAERINELIQASGNGLDENGTKIAQCVGVTNPEKVRILEKDHVPQPDHPVLIAASLQTGLLGSDTAGLTLGYSVFIKSGCMSTRLLSHELRHVHQYESFQSISDFLTEYFQQVIINGYYDAPLERDARQYELSVNCMKS